MKNRQNNLMSTPAAPPTVPASMPQAVSVDALNLALAESVRRRLIRTLADGQPRTAAELTANSGRALDATLKYLIHLRAAGIVIMFKNPIGSQRNRYKLNPAIPVTKTETGWEIDFGYCVVRCW
jgi:predicted transcriptional regulator